MNIKVNGNEKYKSEIINNNIVESMESMRMTKGDQIEYLKNKVIALETEMHLKLILSCTILAGFLGIGFGLYFVAVNSYLFGVVLTFVSTLFMLYRILLLLQNQSTINKSESYEKLESIRETLDRKLK